MTPMQKQTPLFLPSCSPPKTLELLVKLEAKGWHDKYTVVQDHSCGIDEEGQKKLLHTDIHFSTFGTNNKEGCRLGLLLCPDFVVKNEWGESRLLRRRVKVLYSVFQFR